MSPEIGSPDYVVEVLDNHSDGLGGRDPIVEEALDLASFWLSLTAVQETIDREITQHAEDLHNLRRNRA